MKFGGKGLGTSGYIDEATDIVVSNRSRNPVVVDSAIGVSDNPDDHYGTKTTDHLFGVADVRLTGNTRSYHLKQVINRHKTILRELTLDDDLLNSEFKFLQSLLARRKEYRSQQMYEDEVVALGEVMSVNIFSKLLNEKGYKSIPLDAQDIGFITNSRFGNADIRPESYEEIRKFFIEFDAKNPRICPVVTGYIGKNRKNQRTTLGRGGTDYTAIALGAALERDVEVWKKIEGFYRVSPGFVKSPGVVDKLSFNEAEILSKYGGKILQEKSIGAARKGNKNIWIRFMDDPNAPGTLIISGGIKKGKVKAITTLDGVKVLRSRPKNYFQRTSISSVLAGNKDVDVFFDSYVEGEPGYAIFVVRDNGFPSIQDHIMKTAEIGVSGEDDNHIIQVVGDNISRNHNVHGRIGKAMNKVELLLKQKNEMEIERKRKKIPFIEPIYKIQPVTEHSYGIVCTKEALHPLMEALYEEFKDDWEN